MIRPIHIGLCIIVFTLLFYLPGCSNTPPQVEVPESKPDPKLFESAHTTFINLAEEVAKSELATVSGNSPEIHNGPGRTYVSLGCYWWPDPGSDNGLPYIRRDGEVNPETRTDESDLPAMIRMAKRVQILAAAYRITSDEQFAKAANRQLRAWFTDPETAMLPHLENAQMVRGRNTGRSYGVIDTWWLVRVVNSLELLRGSESWESDLENGLKAWFTHYLNWLSFSEFGIEESHSKNNHGTWYDVQVVSFALFTGQTERAAHHLEEISKKRIARQIGRNGMQRHELRRPRPEHYTIYNLYGFLKLASLGYQTGVDLTSISGFWGTDLQDATYFALNLMEEKNIFEPEDDLDRTDTAAFYIELLLMASDLFNDPVFRNEANRKLNKTFEHKPDRSAGLYMAIKGYSTAVF